MTKKLAVILFNLGGPDDLDAVQPFLFNLFNDPAIIGLPAPFRGWLARFISSRRAPVAQEIYKQMDGRSPILPLTIQQANELEKELNQRQPIAGFEVKTFIAMRYWHPRAVDVAKEVAAWQPDEQVLLPLYPQYSTSTTASSVKEWKKESVAAGLLAPIRTVCCYPTAAKFIASHAEMIRHHWREACEKGAPRLLFSAHGLPEKTIQKGDPYQWQVEETSKAIVRELESDQSFHGLDWNICYQSRVGPLAWIGPSTEEEIKRAGKEKKPLVIVPVAFVSEHSETLVELDIEYGHLAEASGVPHYTRIPALGAQEFYSQALGDAVRQAITKPAGNTSPAGVASGGRLCPSSFRQCPCRG
jgi:ferrochelatase